MTFRPFDLKRWASNNPQAEDKIPAQQAAKANPVSPQNNPNRTSDAYSQAREWISKTPPAISGQGGHNATFRVCCILLKGFCLSSSESKSLLNIWNQTCIPEWSSVDLDKKLSDAESSVDLKPRGWMLNKQEFKFGKVAGKVFEEKPAEQPSFIPQQTPEHSGIVDDPAAIAIDFYKDHIIEGHNLCCYRWWEEQFYRYDGTRYEPLPRKKMESDLFAYIEKRFMKQYVFDCSQVPQGDDVSKVKKRKVNNMLINNVTIGLINHVDISSHIKSEPFWLGDAPSGWNPDEVISAKNCLVHLPSFIRGSSLSRIERTPSYFSTSSLSYDFNYKSYSVSAKLPPTWSYFLDSVLGKDKESIECLQEMFGYLITPATRFQKIFMLIGPKRSGKGTIIRILKHMIGRENVCFPTFKSFTGEFGSQPLIGKSLVVFPDARITGRTDVGDVVEKILSISGEDDQTVNRKHLGQLTTKLRTRFIISSNELPRLTENSGALVSRAIIFKFDNTFFGEEDIELEDKLVPEVPAILRWSLDGYDRLMRRKKFIQPASSTQMLDEFLNISSPISHYLADSIEVGESYTTDTKTLYQNWIAWCQFQGRREPGDMDRFIRDLRSALPKINLTSEQVVHNGDGVAWSRVISGLKVKATVESTHANGSMPSRWGDAVEWTLKT